MSNKFNFFCEICENISLTNSRIEKTNILFRYLKLCTPVDGKQSVYLLEASIAVIYENIVFNISESLLIKTICLYFQKSEFKLNNDLKIFGDLGSVAYNYFKNINILQEVSICEVFENLILLSKITGKNSQEKKINFICEILNKLNAISIKYLIRIIEGNLRIGLSSKTILSSCALFYENINYELLEETYYVNSDLGLIVYKILNNEIEYFKDPKPIINIPIQLQAAKTFESFEKILKKINIPFIVQPKFDGFRLQLHLNNNNEINIFSRNLLLVNNMFPEIIEKFKALNKQKIFENIILDGEIVVYNEENNSYSSFSEIASRKRKNDIDLYLISNPIHYVIFDILYLNNESYLKKTYEERLKKLTDIFNKNIFLNFHNLFKLIESYKIYTEDKLIYLYEDYINTNYEGIMIKDLNSFYEPGKRSDKWLKWKHIQNSSLGDTLDFVIVGYYYGKGRKIEQSIGALLLAVYDKENDLYKTIVKTGTGMKVEKWKEIYERCESIKTLECPMNVKYSEIHKPDVFCNPNIVVSIKANCITESPTHTSLYSCRFPRLFEIKYDKNPTQSTLLNEIIYLFNLTNKKIRIK